MEWDCTIRTVHYYLLQSTDNLVDCNVVGGMSTEMYNLTNSAWNHHEEYKLEIHSNITNESCHLLACVINSTSYVTSSCSNSDCFNCELIEFPCNSSFCVDDGDDDNDQSSIYS